MKKYLFGLFIIFLGIFLLIDNLGYLEQSTKEDLVKSWPLLLVIIGLGLVMRRHIFGKLITFLAFLLSVGFTLAMSLIK